MIEVTAGILTDGVRILVWKRRAGESFGLKWEFPGGKRHSGESVEQCLRREMLEEIGLDVTVGPLWRALTHVYPDRRVSIYFYLCESRGGSPRPIECAEIRWIPPHDLNVLPFVEGDLLVLPDLARELGARAV